MHHEFYALGVSIVIKHVDVEVWVGGLEIEYIIFRVSEPVLPAYVPAFNQKLVETMLGSEVNVFFYIVVVGRMLTMCLY